MHSVREYKYAACAITAFVKGAPTSRVVYGHPQFQPRVSDSRLLKGWK
jgi:hypothetical protein